MIVEYTFWINGKGLVAFGKADSEPLVTQVVEIKRPGRDSLMKVCGKVKSLDICCGEDSKKNVAILLKYVEEGEIVVGDEVVF
jgi:hypothetical protein